jgi:ketosteroid isomerase-like protein
MRIRPMTISTAAACLFLCTVATAAVTGTIRESARTHPEASTAASTGTTGTPSDESQIRAVLDTQVAAWNRGDIDAFMKYYWRSEKTLFVGANGVTRGWQAVLDRYHRSYPDRKAMGHLTFSNIEIEQDCPQAAVVIGEYHLQREKDSPSGVFTLNFRKFPEGWRIVVDHTTAFSSARMAARKQ